MKKILLLSIAMFVSFGIMAQVSTKSSVLKTKASKIESVKIESKDLMKIHPVEKEGNYLPAAPAPIKKSGAKNPKAPQYTQISTSSNVFSVILTAQNCLSANQDGNLIAFTHRTGTEYGNDIQISFSTDGGNTFDDQSIKIWDDATNGLAARYPAGVIYNPNGLTDLSSIYAVGAGPVTGGSGWVGGFFASQTFTGQNYDYSMSMLADAGAENNYLPRYHMQVSGEKVFLYGYNVIVDTIINEYVDIKTTINIGTWNAATNSFDWTLSEFSPNNDIVKKDNGGLHAWGVLPAMAFDDDGLTGYLVYTGRDKTYTDT